ncbi:hypothetical protein ACFLWU_06660 [Chloroflexota bacterium]
MTVKIFIVLAVIVAVILMTLGQNHLTGLFPTGLILAFSVCAILVMYWSAYYYYNRKYGGKE